MLKRIYVDNFRCLANFELVFGSLNLFLGENGSGKSSIFEVLHRLRQFIGGEADTNKLFKAADLARWNTGTLQIFEIDIEGNGGTYRYGLTIEQNPDIKKSRVKEEKLEFDRKLLFYFADGTAQLYHDDHTPGPQYPFDWSHSGISLLNPRSDNKKLTWFKKTIEQFVIVGIVPSLIRSDSSGEDAVISRNAENFASWYRYLSQEHQDKWFRLVEELRSVLPGFRSFRLAKTGEESRALQVVFSTPSSGNSELCFGFDELSDGQKTLVVLYTFLYGLSNLGYSLFLDEPDNYLALPEIQPWLHAVSDLCGREIQQVAMISHHPELINYLGASAGIWFDREQNGPARVSSKVEASPSGLTLAENAARGWK
jgi:predicted ATPase